MRYRKKDCGTPALFVTVVRRTENLLYFQAAGCCLTDCWEIGGLPRHFPFPSQMAPLCCNFESLHISRNTPRLKTHFHNQTNGTRMWTSNIGGSPTWHIPLSISSDLVQMVIPQSRSVKLNPSISTAASLDCAPILSIMFAWPCQLKFMLAPRTDPS